jgi:hypothetical protein
MLKHFLSLSVQLWKRSPLCSFSHFTCLIQISEGIVPISCLKLTEMRPIGHFRLSMIGILSSIGLFSGDRRWRSWMELDLDCEPRKASVWLYWRKDIGWMGVNCVNMHGPNKWTHFLSFSSIVWTDFVNQTGRDTTAKGCWIFCAPFGNVDEATNPIDGPKNWTWAQWHVHFLTGLFWYLFAWLCLSRISRIIFKESALIHSDHIVAVNRRLSWSPTGNSRESVGDCAFFFLPDHGKPDKDWIVSYRRSRTGFEGSTRLQFGIASTEFCKKWTDSPSAWTRWLRSHRLDTVSETLFFRHRDSPFHEMPAPVFYWKNGKPFCPIHQLKLGGDCMSRENLERRESDECSWFHGHPKCTEAPWFVRQWRQCNVDGRTRTFKGDIGEVEIISRKPPFALVSARH